MGIPDYETLMRPSLELLSDGKDHLKAELREKLALEFHLTQGELRQRLPSGNQELFHNRVAWALVYLKQAMAVETPRRATYRITARGRRLLATAPTRITKRDLLQFPEMVDFINRSSDGLPHLREARSRLSIAPATPIHQEDHGTATPEEMIAMGHSVLAQQLSTELLERVKSESPDFFESLVIDLLLALGYGGSREDAGQVVGRSGDGGIDGIIKEDKLGLDAIYVQAKRWVDSVGRPELQKFAGALQGKRAKKGVFITTSDFSKEAVDYVEAIDSKIILINGEELARLMIDHNVGVAVKQTYSVKHIDQDYFSED